MLENESSKEVKKIHFQKYKAKKVDSFFIQII